MAISLAALGARTSQEFALAGLAGSVLRRSMFARFPAVSVAERLAMLPRAVEGLDAPVRIRWTQEHVPLVEAASAHGAATGLGVVHGHLRLAQMELMRRAAQGRIAEVAGRPAAELDALLRLIDFPRATEASLDLMPAQTHAFLEGFARGINAVAATAPPPEFALLGLESEPFTVRDLFAISRLCSADYAWRVWATLNELRHTEHWATLWADIVGVADPAAVADFPPATFTHTGSNAYAASGARTTTGKPMFACDPHLVLTAPSPWLIAGLKIPAVTVWGLMIPALPIFGVGRNAHGAWGGTNLHATSSALVDVCDEPLTSVETEIDLRGGGTVRRTVRQSAFGPVVSDDGPFKMTDDTVALHWIGHRASDEYTPFLKLMQATDWSDFQDAMDGASMPGLNMVWADRHGDIGKLIACHVPRSPLGPPADLITTPAGTKAQWATLLTARDLPVVHNPAEGFVVSANEAPHAPPVTISLFFAEPTRADRIAAILGTRAPLSLNDLKALQQDTHLAPAAALAARFATIGQGVRPEASVVAAIGAWDGDYGERSAGALAFELVAAGFVDRLEAHEATPIASAAWQPFTRLSARVARASAAALEAALGEAIDAAEPLFVRHGVWGALHRFRLAHPLARLPWLKPRLPSLDLPIGGSNETLMKSTHPFTDKVHATGFGANARFLADLSDPDETYALVLGGQDGWPASRSMFDMVGAWRRGDYVRLPMGEAAISDAFLHVSDLMPADA